MARTLLIPSCLLNEARPTVGDPGRALADIDHFWMRLLCCPDIRLARRSPRPVHRHLVSSRAQVHIPVITHIRLVGESGAALGTAPPHNNDHSFPRVAR